MRTMVLWALVLVLAGCSELAPSFAVHTPTPSRPPLGVTVMAPGPGPTATPNIPGASSPSLTHTPEAPVARVCTGYPGGALNVRACPGAECAVRLILPEGQVVHPVQEEVRVGGSVWVRLQQPLGWVNRRYLCWEGHP